MEAAREIKAGAAFRKVRHGCGRVLTALIAAGCGLAGAAWLSAEPTRAELTNAMQVRRLLATELAQHPPVHLRGVITFHEPATGITFLQDQAAGIGVAAGVPSRLPTGLKEGMLVEVQGVAAPGAFAPVVAGKSGSPPEVKALGVVSLPNPRGLELADLLGGSQDGQWVELRGIIRSLVAKPFAPPVPEEFGEDQAAGQAAAIRLSIELGTAFGRFTVIVPWRPEDPPPTRLVNARVAVRGVLGSIVNQKRQWKGLLLYVPSLNEIGIERPPSADPFNLPLRAVDQIMTFQPEPQGEARVRVKGQVTLKQPGYRFFLSSDQGALEVQTPHSLAEVRLGSWVEAVGYPTLMGRRVVLQDALLRVASNSAPAKASRVSVGEALARDLDGELIAVNGRLFQNTMRGASRLLIIESGGQLVEATMGTALDPESRRAFEQLQPGTELELSGIAQVASAADWGGGLRPLSLSLLLRDIGDVRILHKPPWWTTRRLLGLVTVLVLLVLLGVVWVYLLRRRVERQTRIIRRNVQQEAVWEERSRIAQDIHDDVGAALTQISLLGELGRREGVEAGAMKRQLEKVVEKSREAVRALDEIVWTVNPRNDTAASAASYLCQAVQDFVRDSALRCRLQVPDELPESPLGAKARHHLFLAVREAVNNVVKHAGATELRLSIRVELREFVVGIEDNGRGFDPGLVQPERNGLGNLRRRLADVGGRFELTSQAGQGTRIILMVPLEGCLP